MTDAECVELLRLLHKYLEEYGYSADSTVGDIAEDAAMSMSETTDEADELRRKIEALRA